MQATKYNMSGWSSVFPTEGNVGQWLFVKHQETRESAPRIRIREVRKSKEGKLYLAEEANMGMTHTAYGVPLDCYDHQFTSFCGPIQMPPDFQKV